MKSRLSNFCDAFWNGYRSKISALIKSSFSNCYNTAGNGNGIKPALIKSITANSCNTTGNGNRVNIRVAESVTPYGCNAIFYYNSRIIGTKGIPRDSLIFIRIMIKIRHFSISANGKRLCCRVKVPGQITDCSTLRPRT